MERIRIFAVAGEAVQLTVGVAPSGDAIVGVRLPTMPEPVYFHRVDVLGLIRTMQDTLREAEDFAVEIKREIRALNSDTGAVQ